MYELWFQFLHFLLFSLHAAAIPALKPLQPMVVSPSSNLPGLRNPQSFNATITPVTTSETRFPIPHTSLLLNIVTFPDHPLDRRGLGRAILNAKLKVRQHLATHHDSYLFPEDEPFAANDTNDAHPAVFLDLENYDSFDRGHQRLRYSTIESVLQGLWIFLYQGRRELDAVFHIEDGGHRLVVGFGKVYGEGVRVKFA